MQMCDAVDRLEYLEDNPCSDAILQAVHLEPNRKQRPIDETAALDQISQIQMETGLGPMSPIPDHIKQIIDLTESLKKKL
jgi:hypothetical protein